MKIKKLQKGFENEHPIYCLAEYQDRIFNCLSKKENEVWQKLRYLNNA